MQMSQRCIRKMIHTAGHHTDGPFKSICHLPHDLIIAKFVAYGLKQSSLSLLQDYLTSRKQGVKIGSLYSFRN